MDGRRGGVGGLVGRGALFGAVALGGALWVAAPAFAHVGVDEQEIVAGASTTVSFSFSHGCGESPTNSLRFQIPEGVNNAVPQVHVGWDIEVERAPLAEPVEQAHGQPITERPAIITFTAQDGFEVPSGQRDTVTIAFRAPETEGLLHFPVIQGCVEGSNDWIAEWDGTGDEPESAAPSVRVVADERDDGDDGLAIAGIVLGAAGLLVGGAALLRTRRAPAVS